MASPAGAEQEPLVPPTADPWAIRRGLSARLRADFDTEWEIVLDQAKASKSLDGIRALLTKWRGIVAAEQREPGSHGRMLAKAAHILATGHRPGARNVDDLQDVIEERLGR
jgi:hypothetical protein